MQHKKDEYIFQLVTRAVKEIDSSEICRKRDILVHYFKIENLIKRENYPLQEVITFYTKKCKVLKSKDIATLEKVEIANKLLIKTLSEETRNALKEQLALVSKVGSTFTNLSLMYTYIEENDLTLQSEAKSRQWNNEYKET